MEKNNPERWKEVYRKSYYKHRKKRLEAHKKWRQSERGIKILKKWFKRYRENGKQKLAQRKHYYKNIEKARARARTDYYKHREKNIARMKKWQKSKKGKEWTKAYQKENRIKQLARYASRNAIRRKDMEKKHCEICGDKAEAHHKDYSNPLKIIWLCIKHHRLIHRKSI